MIPRRILTVVVVSLVALAIDATAVEIDTTRARVPETPRRSFGSKVLKATSTLLYSPFYVTEGLGRGLIWLGYDDPTARKIVNLIMDDSRPINPIISFGGNAGFGFGAGMRARVGLLAGDSLHVGGEYSWFKYRHVNLSYEVPLGTSPAVLLALHGGHDFMPREEFFGRGYDSREEDEVSYTEECSSIEAELSVDLTRRVALRGSLGYAAHHLYDGRDPAYEGRLDTIQSQLNLTPDDLRPVRYASAAFGIKYDNRDLPGRPLKGGTRTFDVSFHDGVDDSSELRFYRLRLDIRQYLEIYKKRVFEFRLLAQSIDVPNDEDNPENPLYLLSSLGGKASLRGYEANRFVDRELAMVGVEYRWPIWDVIDVFLCWEEGRVFSSFSDDFTFKNWRESYGGGIRIWSPWGEIMRFQLAGSDEEFRVLFGMGATVW